MYPVDNLACLISLDNGADGMGNGEQDVLGSHSQSHGAQGPLVSVILAVHNREACVGRAIASVLAQTYRNLELIVVDDGSSDGTRLVVESFGSPVTLITQAHTGVYTARNRALSQARGELVAFIDSDDAWLSDKLAVQVPFDLGRSLEARIDLFSAELTQATDPATRALLRRLQLTGHLIGRIRRRSHSPLPNAEIACSSSRTRVSGTRPCATRRGSGRVFFTGGTHAEESSEWPLALMCCHRWYCRSLTCALQFL